MQLMAGEELRDALTQRRIDPGKAVGLAERLREDPMHGRGRLWFYGLVWLLSLVALAVGCRDLSRWKSASYALIGMSDPIQSFGHFIPFHRNLVMEPAKLLGEFTLDQEELLFGYTSDNYWEGYLKLHQRSPEDAVLYAEHVKSLARWNKLPADFIAAADEIDPENGWFRYLAAGYKARTAVHTLGYGKRIRYQIKDPALLTEAMGFMEEAAEKPKFDSYRDEMLLRRLALLPPGDDVLGRFFVQEYVSSEGGNDHFVHRALGDAIAAKAEDLAAKGEKEAFLKLCETQRLLARRVLENARSTTFDSLWSAAVLRSPSPATMEKAAKNLGLDGESEQIRKTHAALEELWRKRKSRVTGFYGRGSIAATRSGWDSLSTQPLNFESMKPGVKAEHALFDRILCYGGWVVLLIAAGLAASCRFRHGRQARLLSLSLLRTIAAKDHAWIIGSGIVLPFTCYLVAENVPALAGTEWSVRKTIPGDAVRIAAVLALMVSVPVMVAAWRLDLGWGRHSKSRWRWLGGLATLAAIVAWVGGCTIGNGKYGHRMPELFQAGIIAAGICVAWHFLIGLLGVLIRERGEVLKGMVLCRTVIPAYAVGMLLMAAASFLFHAEEKAWVAKDTFTKVDPAVPAASRFDHETAMQIRAESLRVLDAKE